MLRTQALDRLRRQWQPLVDVALLAATSLLFVLSGTIVSVPLAVAQLVPLVWRRHRPVLVLVVVGGATAAHTTLGMARAVGFFPATIALYTAATHRSPVIRWLLCPAIGLAMATASAVRHGWVEGLLMAVVTVSVAWLAGVERGEHLRRRAEAEQQAARLRMERQVAEDRDRLARRVHDTLAHTVTVMLLQTEAVQATASLDPDLREMLPVPVRAVTHRLIGEAAANALRHDGPGALLTIMTTTGAGTLHLRITSRPGSTHSGRPRRDTAGFGLLSLAEDIRGYGGKLTYGPQQPSGWLIEAAVPLRSETAQVSS